MERFEMQPYNLCGLYHINDGPMTTIYLTNAYPDVWK